MTELKWDQVGERRFEAGVDHGVLYKPNNLGVYDTGFAWNGLVTVTESPSGAEANAQYADNIKYLNLVSAESFGGTLEALTYPNEFEECNGYAEPQPGVFVGQQSRKSFGLCYRTRIGNDVNQEAGYKLHLLYGLLAAPSEKAYGTINESPEALTFSWDLSATPVDAGAGLKPTASLTIDSTKVDEDALAALETQLYGSVGVEPKLPTPAQVIALFDGVFTTVRMTGSNAPSYNSSTHVVTLPAVTGVVWFVNDVETGSGALAAMSVGQSKAIKAVPLENYVLTGDTDWVYDY